MNWDLVFTKRPRATHDYAAFLASRGFTKTFKIINVVGTNGKGSVSNFLAQGLASAGHRVGLFTSPHVILPNERIQINGVMITDDEFAAYVQLLGAEEVLTFNFFAILYLVAMMHFYHHNCDYVVLEAGIGGSYDLTRTIPGDFGVVTSIALDHTALLGATLEAIAGDKSGIIHPQMHFYIPSLMPSHLQEFFKKRTVFYAVINNAGPTYREQNERLAKGILMKWGLNFKAFRLPPGRTELRINNGVKAIVDVAHNLDGIEHALAFLRRQKITYHRVVISLRRTKDAAGLVALFSDVELHVYQPNSDFYAATDFHAKELNDLHSYIREQSVDTLYIGSFTLAGLVLKALLAK